MLSQTQRARQLVVAIAGPASRSTEKNELLCGDVGRGRYGRSRGREQQAVRANSLVHRRGHEDATVVRR